MKKVFVLGSVNTDFMIGADRMPMLGESLKGYGFMSSQGGKGANQAVACKKLGCENVFFIGAVGKDLFGKELIRSLNGYGVNTEAVSVHGNAYSGVCMILLDKSRNDNALVVDPGANECVDCLALEEFLDKNARADDVFITQLEVNHEAVERGLSKAKALGMYTVLNPAPARRLGKEILVNVDLVVLNETEADLISGIFVRSEREASEVYRYFSAYGVKETIITLGARGCIYSDGTEVCCPARKVKTVDSTAAGDTFIGALALKKAQGKTIAESLDFASTCSAITVSRAGAAISIPTAEEVCAFMQGDAERGNQPSNR